MVYRCSHLRRIDLAQDHLEDFSSNLRKIIDRMDMTAEERKQLTSEVGISASAFSHYLSGSNSPSLQKLIRLAGFLKVSLDELVLGSRIAQEAPSDNGMRDFLIRELQYHRQHTDMVHKLEVEVLANFRQDLRTQCEQALRGVREADPRLREVWVSFDDAKVLERFSDLTCIASMDFRNNLVYRQEDGSPEAGQFLEIVASGISSGKRFRFLFPSHASDRNWNKTVKDYRAMLVQRGVGRDDALNSFEARVTKETSLATGFGFYEFDPSRWGNPGEWDGTQADESELKMRELYLRHGNAITDGRLGFAILPDASDPSICVMDRYHNRLAYNAFERMWRLGRPIK
jgi:transcriptional regulator with XRE-family HTH domain